MEWTDGKKRCKWANPKNDIYLHGSLTLNHLKISRKARNGFIFCQILIFILHVTYKYCIMYLRWHK